MKLVKLTEDEMYERLNRPYNAPHFDSRFSEVDFRKEWREVRNSFEVLLRRYGENDAYGEKDFTLGDGFSFSRGIGVELTSKKMLNKQLIPETQSFLGSLSQEYEIDFAVMTEEGIFHLFVDADTVRECIPNSVARKLL